MQLKIDMDNASFTATSDDGVELFSYEVSEYSLFIDTNALVASAGDLARLVAQVGAAISEANHAE